MLSPMNKSIPALFQVNPLTPQFKEEKEEEKEEELLLLFV
jgi:hypothetical protein